MDKNILREMTIGEAGEVLRESPVTKASSFDEFAQSFETDLVNNLISKGITDIVTERDPERNDRTDAESLHVIRHSMSTRVDLRLMHDRMQDGEKYDAVIDETASEIADIFKDYGLFRKITEDYEKAKPYLFLELIPSDKNRAITSGCPHDDILDLSVIYRLRFSEKDHEVRSVIITDEILDTWGIDEDTLKKDAKQYAPRNFPAVLQSMSEVLHIEENGPEVMWVASNKSRTRGAGVIMYPGYLDEICKRIGCQTLFIIPSSVHEVICISADDGSFTARDLDEMVMDVNAGVVRPEEVLSSTSYFYDSRTKLFARAKDHEKDSSLNTAYLPDLLQVPA